MRRCLWLFLCAVRPNLSFYTDLRPQGSFNSDSNRKQSELEHVDQRPGMFWVMPLSFSHMLVYCMHDDF